jgi:hypothetical protein
MKYIPLKLYIMISVVHANFIRIWGVRVTHLFNFLYCVFFSVCLVLCLVSNVAVFSELPLQFSLNYSFSFLWISPSVFSELPLQFSLNYPFSFLWITPSVFSNVYFTKKSVNLHEIYRDKSTETNDNGWWTHYMYFNTRLAQSTRESIWWQLVFKNTTRH